MLKKSASGILVARSPQRTYLYASGFSLSAALSAFVWTSADRLDLVPPKRLRAGERAFLNILHRSWSFFGLPGDPWFFENFEFFNNLLAALFLMCSIDDFPCGAHPRPF